MKFFMFFVFLVTLVVSVDSFAQNADEEVELLVMDGTWKGDTYRDAKRSIVYRMDEFGAVKDKKGNDIIIVIGNSYRNRHNQVIGRFLVGEEVRSSSGRLLGRINQYGEIRDFYGTYLGELKDLTPQQAAVQYFLWDQLVERHLRTRKNQLPD